MGTCWVTQGSTCEISLYKINVNIIELIFNVIIIVQLRRQSENEQCDAGPYFLQENKEKENRVIF